MDNDFHKLLTEIQPRLYGYIFSLLPSRSLAKDIMQDTNMILCKKSEDYDPEGNFTSWVFSIAKYQVLSCLTKQKRSKLILRPDIVELVAGEVEETFSVKEDLCRHLKHCIGSLNENNRCLIRLKYEDDKSLEEIAEHLGRSFNSVVAALRRVRVKLSTCIRARMIEREQHLEELNMISNEHLEDNAKKIVEVEIGPYPQNKLDPFPRVRVTLEGGDEKTLFSFCPDEVSFSKKEILGLTEKQARQLYYDKDIHYLRT